MFKKIITNILFLSILSNPKIAFAQASGLQDILEYIDSNNYLNGKQYSFLSPIVNDKDVVLLGESIHLTREFPLVRIGMIKYLNQNHDFNVIAMEGGAADYWAAQDILFSSQKNAPK